MIQKYFNWLDKKNEWAGHVNFGVEIAPCAIH
jgi:hypothetical protein